MSEEMKALREQLLRNDKNGYDTLDEAQLAEMEAYCADYKVFLNEGKTERLSARAAIAAAEAKGFVQYKRGMALKAGDKVYTCNRGKGLMLAVIGKESLAEGAQIAAAHIDSPRLDLKPTPLYEDSEMAYFKTHYYGGIRKYQWVTIPLQLRGVVAKKDGSVVDVCIGEAGEPQLVITDLLPHLGGEQGRKPLNEAVPGETLNLLHGKQAQGVTQNRRHAAVLAPKPVKEKIKHQNAKESFRLTAAGREVQQRHFAECSFCFIFRWHDILVTSHDIRYQRDDKHDLEQTPSIILFCSLLESPVHQHETFKDDRIVRNRINAQFETINLQLEIEYLLLHFFLAVFREPWCFCRIVVAPFLDFYIHFLADVL